MGPPVPFVRRVVIRNYRSIAECDVTLGPLTVLLGFNASGKSNFLDALRFVADALSESPVAAVDDRGGLEALLHRGPGGIADSFGISLDVAVRIPDEHAEVTARFGFTIGPDPQQDLPLLVLEEVADVGSPGGPRLFRVDDPAQWLAGRMRARGPLAG
jgi:predicted ATPase